MPAIMELSSPWSASVDADSPLPEYPRPDMVRPDWLSLNGPWEYAIRESGPGALADEVAPDFGPADRRGRIIVPFAPECALSGVGKTAARSSCPRPGRAVASCCGSRRWITLRPCS